MRRRKFVFAAKAGNQSMRVRAVRGHALNRIPDSRSSGLPDDQVASSAIIE
jgi:hypothetical protein